MPTATMESECRKLARELKARREAGELLAALCFNLVSDKRLDDSLRVLLMKRYKEWDAIPTVKFGEEIFNGNS